MITDDIVTAYRRGKWALIIRGLIAIAVGVVIVARPLESVAAFALVVAIWALFEGIVNIVRAFELKSVTTHWWVMLLSGIISGAFGVAAIYYYPVLSLTFAVLWTAWWLITSGVVGIYASVQEKKLDLPWGWTLTFGIVSLAGGVVAFFYPGMTLVALMGMLSAFGIISGIVMLIAAAKLQSFEHHVHGAMHGAARA